MYGMYKKLNKPGGRGGGGLSFRALYKNCLRNKFECLSLRMGKTFERIVVMLFKISENLLHYNYIKPSNHATTKFCFVSSKFVTSITYFFL